MDRTTSMLQHATRWFSGLSRRRRLDEDGVSAVEFALFAPILFLSLLAMVDLGLAIYERMTIDHVLRAGAQVAMADPGVPGVLTVLNTTAAKNFSEADKPDFQVNRDCACPEAKGTVVACSTTCSGPTSTFIYYRLSGAKDYQGMIIPQIALGPKMQIQIR
jgi:pilus assembly protein CpaE